MKLGFIKPNFPNEKRVALLPEHINDFPNEIIVESGFGDYLNISDQEYIDKGCKILTREQTFAKCDAISLLKLIQESDYKYLKNNQMLIGWTHPEGSGAKFYQNIAIDKCLTIVDLDNIHPTVYYKEKKKLIDFIPKNFIQRNSFLAGYSSVMHGIISYGKIPNSNTKVAVLSSGNVAQGAFNAISKFTDNVTIYYRKTMDEFHLNLCEFDIIINGIEMDKTNLHILTIQDQSKLKKGCLIIDAAADAGNAIEGTKLTTIDNPIYSSKNIYFYEVNNTPSIYFRDSSYEISKSFSKYVYSLDVKKFLELKE